MDLLLDHKDHDNMRNGWHLFVTVAVTLARRSRRRRRGLDYQ